MGTHKVDPKQIPFRSIARFLTVVIVLFDVTGIKILSFIVF